MQEKIIELETKFSYQEDMLQQLNDEVIRQQRQLEGAIGEIRELRQQFSDLLAREGSRQAKRAHRPSEGQYISLTLALLPLRGRHPRKLGNERSPR